MNPRNASPRNCTGERTRGAEPYLKTLVVLAQRLVERDFEDVMRGVGERGVREGGRGVAERDHRRQRELR